MKNLFFINKEKVQPVIEKPSPDKIISGDPIFTTWNQEQTNNDIYAGIWQSTAGKWKINYNEWEYCHILSGKSIISDNDGNSVNLKTGDSFVIQPGFTGYWEVIETTIKEYVIVL